MARYKPLAIDLLALDEALQELAEVSLQMARAVDLRFFAGLEMNQVAEVLDTPKRTLEREWGRRGRGSTRGCPDTRAAEQAGRNHRRWLRPTIWLRTRFAARLFQFSLVPREGSIAPRQCARSLQWMRKMGCVCELQSACSTVNARLPPRWL
ncbi:MAG: hypothetical protein IPJ19_16535 [Planctomycetes bacterium]|nr:hypothetical protein [Planctomycetota bacterium]